MLPAEQNLLAALEAFLVNQELPAVVAAEEGRLPSNYSGIAAVATAAVMPQILAALDKLLLQPVAVPAAPSA